MSSFQDTFTDATNLILTEGSEVVGGELRPADHDDGTVLTFNGSSQYGIAIGYKGVTGSSACTIMGWFRTTDNGATSQRLIEWGTGATFGRRLVGLESGVLWDRMVTDTVSGGSKLADGQWHHFAIVNPASAATSDFLIYIDGISVEVATTTSGGTINIISGTDVSISASNFFEGSLNDFRIYSTDLSASEVFNLVINNEEPSTTNLQAQWLFNDGSGSTASDETINGRDITLTGSPTWTTTHVPFYGKKSQSESTELVTDAGSISDFYFTLGKKSGGQVDRFQFSNDGSTWVNDSGELVGDYGAYNFDGTNDQITFGSDASIDNIFSGGGTVMFWVYARSYGEGTLGRVFHKGVAGTNTNSTQMFFSGVDIVLYRDFSTTNGSWRTPFEFPLKQWVHVAVTYNDNSTANNPSFYFNGVLVTSITEDSTPVGSALSDAAYNLTMGSWNSTLRWHDGLIADFRIYKGDILSATTIYNYYTQGTEPSETLDAHWKFNGNALDETANNNDGTVTGATNTTTPGQLPTFGYGLTGDVNTLFFDGVNDRITVADSNELSFGNGSTDSAFSVAAWIYMHDATSFNIIMKDNNSSAREWRFKTDGSDLLILVLIDQSSGGIISKQSGTITHLENQWIHVAATYDGSRSHTGISLYINGARVDTVGSTGGTYTAMENTSQIVEIGAWAGASQYSYGRIANASIWNDVRTSAEIISEVQSGVIDVTNANLIAHWSMVEGSGGTAFDNTSNISAIHNGSITGAGWIDDLARPVIFQPPQYQVDISGLGFVDFYYRYLTDSSSFQLTTAVTEVTVDYLTVQNIVIRDAGNNIISDGEATPQSFGTTVQNDTSPTLTFTIQNTGETTLTISSINLPSGYSISGSTPSSVAGSSSENFIVQLSTATVGTFSGDVEVNTDDPDTATYNFAITGEIRVAGFGGEVCSIYHGFLEDDRISHQRLRYLRPSIRESLKRVLC